MSACIIRRRSDGLYRSRSKQSWDKDKHWVSDIKKARIFTNVGHAKVSLRDRTGVLSLHWTNVKGKLTYNCENCCDAKRHYCPKHTAMFPLISKWLTKCIDNNFNWVYEAIPVEYNIPPEVKIEPYTLFPLGHGW